MSNLKINAVVCAAFNSSAVYGIVNYTNHCLLMAIQQYLQCFHDVTASITELKKICGLINHPNDEFLPLEKEIYDFLENLKLNLNVYLVNNIEDKTNSKELIFHGTIVHVTKSNKFNEHEKWGTINMINYDNTHFELIICPFDCSILQKGMRIKYTREMVHEFNCEKLKEIQQKCGIVIKNIKNNDLVLKYEILQKKSEHDELNALSNPPQKQTFDDVKENPTYTVLKNDAIIEHENELQKYNTYINILEQFKNGDIKELIKNESENIQKMNIKFETYDAKLLPTSKKEKFYKDDIPNNKKILLALKSDIAKNLNKEKQRFYVGIVLRYTQILSDERFLSSIKNCIVDELNKILQQIYNYDEEKLLKNNLDNLGDIEYSMFLFLPDDYTSNESKERTGGEFKKKYKITGKYKKV